MKKPTEEACRLLPADAHSAEVLEPGNRAFDRPSAIVSSKRTTVLSDVLEFPAATMWRAHFDSLLSQLCLKSIAVIRLVANHTQWRFGGQHEVEHVLDDLTLMGTGRGGIQRNRQPAFIHQKPLFSRLFQPSHSQRRRRRESC